MSLEPHHVLCMESPALLFQRFCSQKLRFRSFHVVEYKKSVNKTNMGQFSRYIRLAMDKKEYTYRVSVERRWKNSKVSECGN